MLCGRDTVQIRPSRSMKLNLQDTAERLRRLDEGPVEVNPFLISFKTGCIDWLFFRMDVFWFMVQKILQKLVHSYIDTLAK